MKCARQARALALVVAFATGASCSLVGSVTSAIASTPKLANVQSSELRLGIPQQSEVVVGDKLFHVTKAVIDATPDDVWDVLTDYNHILSYHPNVKNFKILSEAGDKKKVWFSVASMCGLWKFEYVLSMHENKPLHRIEWQRDSGAFKVNEGSWVLEPVDDGAKTLVTYSKHMDGGLLMPKMILNNELRKTMPMVLSNLNLAVIKNKKLAHKPD
jgi:Polyketide cyclase / dehydrase and lipid transport.